MHFDNRHYVVFDLTEVDTIDFSEVMETSADTQPPSVVALTTRSQEYTHEEILTLLAGSDWTDPNVDI